MQARKSTCKVDGCGTKTLAKGMCAKHYQRVSRKGTVDTGDRFNDPEESFASRTEANPDGCLVWTGNLGSNGYGRISVNGKRVKAHRYAWERVNGPIPDGLLIDHICFNRACVNVEHLRLATRAQNAENRSGAVTGSTSGVRGVYLDQRTGKWYVQVRPGGKSYYGGWHDSLEDAAEDARQMRARLMTHAQN